MSHITNNRICYDTHNIVLDPELYVNDPSGEMEYLRQMQSALTPNGDAKLHKAQLDSFNNDGTWTIKLPSVFIEPYWADQLAEATQLLPKRMRLAVSLFNGTYNRTLFSTSCLRSQSFYPLWEAARKFGYTFQREQHRDAEACYFEAYDIIAMNRIGN